MEILPEYGLDGNLKHAHHKDRPLSLKYVNRTPRPAFSIDFNSIFDSRGNVAEGIAFAALQERRGAGRDISYSRNRNFYTGRQSYGGPNYSHSILIPTIDEMARHGFIENHIAENRGPSGTQSTFRATDQLLETAITPQTLGHDPIQTVRLKNADKQLVEYRPTARTVKWEREIAELNEATLASAIGFKDTPGIEKRGQFLIIQGAGQGPQYVDMAHDQYYHVFNRSFNEGGRRVGHFAQQLSDKDDKPYRDSLTINGNSTSEYDYSCLHGQLIYALAGHRLQGDAYDIDGWKRKTVKPAFNILINAETRTQAVRALDYHKTVDDTATAHRLIDAICRKHKPVEHLFHSGLGRRLMNIDTEIMGRVIAELLKMGICPIPIHDSVRAEEQHLETVAEIMERNLDKALQRLVRKGEYVKAA